jgi:hypothetical protein
MNINLGKEHWVAKKNLQQINGTLTLGITYFHFPTMNL